MGVEQSYPELFEALGRVVPESVRIYLVGGAVRDVLLNKPLDDFDFCVEGLVRPIGKKLADALGGKYYLMDDQRDIARVIVDRPGDRSYNIDIALMDGASIEDDLRTRDFTINAVALEVNGRNRLVDPLGGAVDLRRKKLRMCSTTAVQDDPLRAIRAIRMALEYDLTMSDELLGELHSVLPQLGKASFERHRDELLKTIRTNKPAAMLALYRHFGFLDFFFPDCISGDTDSDNEYLNALSRLSTLFTIRYEDKLCMNRFEAFAELLMAGFRDGFRATFDETLTLYHSRRILLQLAGILIRIAGDPADEKLITKWLKRLTFSREETDCVLDSIRAYRFLKSGSEDHEWDEVAAYRFFSAFGVDGLCGMMLYLAGIRTEADSDAAYKLWERQAFTFRFLADAWYHRQDSVVSPEPLLDGNEIVDLFSLKPGPEIGRIKNALIEAQVGGMIHTREEAIGFLRSFQQSVG